MASRKRRIDDDAPVSDHNRPVRESLPLDVVQCIALAGPPCVAGRMAQCCRAWKERLCDNPAVLTQREQLAARREERIGPDGRSVRYLLPNGVVHGYEELIDATGTRQLVHYKHGKRHGTEALWDMLGRPTLLAHWVDGKRHGIEERWHENGTRIYLCHWVQHLKHGSFEIWNEHGFRTHLQNFENGLLHGTQYWWHSLSRSRKEMDFQHGKKHGIEKFFDANGQHVSSHVYEHGNHIRNIQVSSAT